MIVLLIIAIWSLTPYFVSSAASPHHLTLNKNEEIVQSFVKDLALNAKPKQVEKAPNQAALDYLQNIYSIKNGDKNLKKRSVNSSLISDKQAINDSDWISAFNSYSYLEVNQTHKNDGQFWINSCQILQHKELKRAELRIFQSEKDSHFKTAQTFVVSAYELEMEKSKKFCSSVETKSDYSGWLELDVTSCMSSWSRCNSSKPAMKGFQLSIQSANVSDKVHLKDLGLTIFSTNKQVQPFVVVFLKTNKTTNSKSIFNLEKIRGTMQKRCPNKFARCGLIKDAFTLDFADLGLKDFVIAPKSILLSNCCGSCGGSEILNSKLNASFQNSVSDKLNYSCGPTEMKPISVLFFDKEMNVVLATNNLIVNNCGCSVF